jgi:hypothetical protein
MSTMETSATMNATRILIDARLDAIDRALLGRVSRAERLDVVGEVESRIDELLRERCGPGGEPSREDVLAVLARLDPPEAFLEDDETSPRAAEDRPARRASVASPGTPTPMPKGANASVILGLIAAAGSIGLPVGYIMAHTSENMMLWMVQWGLSGAAMMLGGALAVMLGVLERPRRPATILGLIAGSAAFGSGLAEVACTLILTPS